MDGIHLLGEWYGCPADTPHMVDAGALRSAGMNPEDIDLVNAVIAGEPVSDDQHASMGCSIKWAEGRQPAYFG